MSAIDKIEDLATHIKDYIQTRIELLKLRFAATTSKLISNLFSIIIVSLLILLFLAFLGVSTALYIGKTLDSYPLGFLIVSAIFLLTGIICWSLRERILRIPIMNSIISQLHAGKEED